MPGNPFVDISPTPREHFKLYFYACVLNLIERIAQMLGSYESAFETFPFLRGYDDELAAWGANSQTPHAGALWRDWLADWESHVDGRLPLRTLRDAVALDDTEMLLLLSIGLIEEDARFGLLYETMQGIPGQSRLTAGILNLWWEQPLHHGGTYARLARLQELGLMQVVNPDSPRAGWALQILPLLWDVLSGASDQLENEWAQYLPPTELISADDLILPDGLRRSLTTLPTLLLSGEINAVVVRGPQHNGRRTLLGAVACAMGRGLLRVSNVSKPDDERWRLIGPLASLLNAFPAVLLNPAPGETIIIPRLNGSDGSAGFVLGKQGGLSGEGVERALTVTLEMPDIDTRYQHWQDSAADTRIQDLMSICERFRVTGGNIRRMAKLAHAYTRLEGQEETRLEHIQQASRALNRQSLDTLAAYIPSFGDWSYLSVSADTLEELEALESRCRSRERLRGRVSPALSAQMNSGVRALLTGPSGTGKTLAARILASMLKIDLYRLDLSSVVNKYIGETEKNLNEIFSRSEELDVMLLIDEGDALMTQRTNVQTANDRYANLETNYLLQRLETFEGILIITTNANDRIDSAFQRRMDVVVNFRLPDAAERWTIWQLHLPEDHGVEPRLLREMTTRCTLSGGQIRNAVLHATLLALNQQTALNGAHLGLAVEREYRKIGAVCPIRFPNQVDLSDIHLPH